MDSFFPFVRVPFILDEAFPVNKMRSFERIDESGMPSPAAA
jgi:hypothetical protein